MVETGTLLQGRFVIEESLGSGGMGAVYLATDKKFGSRVAIKERAYEHAELAEAFEREARLLNNLHHPVLPHVSDYFIENDRHFLVMEYIDGTDLSEMLKRDGAFSVEDVERWMFELLDALDYLHSQQPPIIHRDIKPPNLKLTPRGNIILLDFGLAKETSGNTLGVRSIFGYSRRYSPFEQIEGAGTDARADLFSLGATVYHLMTGEPPADVLTRVSALVAGRPDPIQPANELNEYISPGLASVIHSALAVNADHRFVSASAMRAALKQAINPSMHVAEPLASAAPVVAAVSAAAAPALASVEPDDREVEPVVEPIGGEMSQAMRALKEDEIRRNLDSYLDYLPAVPENRT
ncbi:MAG: serine/threonine protein kinase, partial [Pyrinomonadaceae bacterium]